jgi:branched-chain amino acid transport system ATP-binding protein
MFGAITGFTRMRSGSVNVAGQDQTRRPPHRLAQQGLVRTFQLTKTLKNMTVLDNMRVAARRHPGESLLGALVGFRASRAREREVTEQARELLGGFGLTRVSGELAGNLSGGQSKLLEMARALMLTPDMLLLDEPLAGVNPTLAEEILTHIDRLRTSGMGFVLVEHDMPAVMRIADQIVVMAEGTNIATGTPPEIQQNHDVIDAYLGTE